MTYRQDFVEILKNLFDNFDISEKNNKKWTFFQYHFFTILHFSDFYIHHYAYSISSKFSCNFEAFASKLEENLRRNVFYLVAVVSWEQLTL